MRRIGILFGQEKTFPPAFVDRVNRLAPEGISAEFVRIDRVVQNESSGYVVIIDRISQDIPFYRAYLKNAALNGTIVINNPFWWSADDKFLNNGLAERVGVRVPRTVLLPSKEHPLDTNEMSMRNLAYPLDWESIFAYVGFPAFFKPYAGGGWKNVYRVNTPEEFFRAYDQTGRLVMMLQEEIRFEDYYRCYCIDRRHVRIMEYHPSRPYLEQYALVPKPLSTDRAEKLEEAVLKLNCILGYDFNTVELAIRDEEPYAIDFGNPAPDADYHSVGPENFEWVVEMAARMAIQKAEQFEEGEARIHWGDFVMDSIDTSFG